MALYNDLMRELNFDKEQHKQELLNLYWKEGFPDSLEKKEMIEKAKNDKLQKTIDNY